MTILEINDESLLIGNVKVGRTMIEFDMIDGRRIVAPLWWYPRLAAATPTQRTKWRILPFGDAVGWEEIDEFISAKALILGGAAPGAVPPAQAAE